MKLLFTATTPDDLAKVTWLTHDCFFDLDQAWHDEAKDTFEVAFGRGFEWKRFFGTSSRDPKTYDCILSVRHVREVKIEDEAQIGIYDLHSVVYDSEQSAVVIEANIPLKIRLTVTELEVRVLTQGEPHTNAGGLSWCTESADLQQALEARRA